MGKKKIKIQTFIFDKTKFSNTKIKKWLKDNDYKYNKIHKVDKNVRALQRPCCRFKKSTLKRVYVCKGIKKVCGYLK